jgi:hypothetical protein
MALLPSAAKYVMALKWRGGDGTAPARRHYGVWEALVDDEGGPEEQSDHEGQGCPISFVQCPGQIVPARRCRAAGRQTSHSEVDSVTNFCSSLPALWIPCPACNGNSYDPSSDNRTAVQV